jgi:pheromone shutdown protein TraB
MYYMGKETKVHKYISDVHNSELILIGVVHDLNWKKVYRLLEEHKPQVVCYEMGIIGGFDADMASEHKAIQEYTQEYNKKKQGVDIENVTEVSSRVDINPTEDGYLEKKQELKENDRNLNIDEFKRKHTEIEEDVLETDSLDDTTLEDIKEVNARTSAEITEEYMFFMRLRNQRMAQNLDKELERNGKVALVVGSAHMPGILRQLEYTERR